MMRLVKWAALTLLLAALPVSGQDGLNLPTELYVLTNAGQVVEYGLGASGIRAVTPDDVFVVDFGIAPDGVWLAYRTEDGLNLARMDTGQVYAVEGRTAGLPQVRGQGDTVAWSPAGDALAYTTAYGARVWFSSGGRFADLTEGAFRQLIWSPDGRYLAAEADNHIWWLYRREGETLILTSAIPSSLGLAWVSLTEVALAPETGGLIRMNLAEGNRQTVLLDDTWVYRLPYQLPDGTLAVFGRQKGEGDPDSGFGRLLGLSPDSPRVNNLGQAEVDTSGLRWTPGGQFMLAFRGGVLAIVAPVTGDGLTLPVADAVAYTWGAPPLERASGVRLSADGFFLAADASGYDQVWRLPADGSPAAPVSKAAAAVAAFAVSPDGRELAFASGGQVWRQPLAGAQAPVPLADAGGSVGELAYSPGGRRLAYTVDGSVWVVSARGGDAAPALAAAGTAYRQPQFARATDVLLASADGAAALSRILDLNTGQTVELGAYQPAIWLADDGRILAGSRSADEQSPQTLVILNPSNLSQLTALAALPYPEHVLDLREVRPGRVRLALGSLRPGPRALAVVEMDMTSGAITPVGDGGYLLDPSLSPDGRFLAGRAGAGGALAFRSLETGRQVVLDTPPGAHAFQWGPGR